MKRMTRKPATPQPVRLAPEDATALIRMRRRARTTRRPVLMMFL